MITVQPGARRLVHLLQRLENLCRTGNDGVMNAPRTGLQPAAPVSCPHPTPALLPFRQCRAYSAVAPAEVRSHAASGNSSWLSVRPGVSPTRPQHIQQQPRLQPQQQQQHREPSQHQQQHPQHNPAKHLSPADPQLVPDVEGTVKKVVYRAAGTGYTVLKIKVMLGECLVSLPTCLRRCC